ncbi:MAG: alginate export family protein [Verrucomicrobia bacterium]|nr:alginate export family protein [Verrucomicrobiota bacterium]
MRLLVVVCAAAVLIGVYTDAFAQDAGVIPGVSNLFVGAELRTRAFWTENLTDLGNDGAIDAETGELVDDDFGYIEQRVRLTTEAELTDGGVWVKLTLEGLGNWGEENDGWETGVVEAKVSFHNIGDSAWSAIAGRQYLHFGRGLLISANELEIEHDAILVTGEYLPWKIALAGIKTVEGGADDLNVYLVDVNWAPAESVFSGGGYVILLDDSRDASDREPIVIGVRGGYDPSNGLAVWGEFAYQIGDNAELDKQAWVLDMGATYLIDTTWNPTVRVNYLYATGDENADDGDDDAFDPLFNYTRYGEAYSPELSNIQIINAGVAIQPSDRTTVYLDWYHYTQNEAAAMSMANPRIVDLGVTALTTGVDDELGQELDLGVTHNYTDKVTASMIVALFFPGDAYGADADDALEIKGTILVSF